MMPPFLAWSELRRTSLSILPRRRTHSLLSLGDEQLAQLAQPQDGAGNRDAHEPVSEIQTHSTERGLQERCVDDQDLQRKRQHERSPQPRVAEQPVERAALVRTGVGGVEELEKNKRGEGHRPRVGKVTGALNKAAGQPVVEHEQGAY